MEHPENSEEYKGLVVNAGIEQPSIVNPYLKFRKKPRRREFSVGEYVEGIVKGNVTVLSQAVTLVESVKPEHQAIAQEVIEKCLPYSGRSIRIGISGVPGAGKSTSIDVFGLHVLRQGGKLAVLAIDPSSERSKGSILGDKTRMEKLSVHPNAFIRPSPSAGSLGGVARKTRETIILCEAGGFDKIFVETVGVGQSETAVHSMVDFFLLIQLAGTGDELQGIKRGIMEMADGIVINKADGNNIEKAKLAASHFRNALHLFPAPDSGWSPKVLTYSGFYGLGIKEIWDMVDEYFAFVKANGYFEQRRNEQAKYWMYESINEHLRDSFYNNETIASMLAVKEEEVLNGKLTSFVAAKKLLDAMVDFFLLIQLAGTGDELQGIKRGIMEMADGIVINKADGNNIEKAKLAASHFRNALHLFPAPDSGWSPKVLTYSGFYGLGIKEIWDMVDEYFAFVKANGYFEQRRNEQAKYWMYESINEHLRDSFYNNETIASMLAVKEEEVLNGKLTSFVAAKKLLDAYYDTLK